MGERAPKQGCWGQWARGTYCCPEAMYEDGMELSRIRNMITWKTEMDDKVEEIPQKTARIGKIGGRDG